MPKMLFLLLVLIFLPLSSAELAVLGTTNKTSIIQIITPSTPSSGNSSGIDSAIANATYIKKGYDVTSGGINFSTQGFCGIHPVFGLFACQSQNDADLYLANDDVLTRMVFANAGYISFVGQNYLDFYTGADILQLKINTTRTYLYNNLDLQNFNITNYWDNQCGNNQSAYGVQDNGTLLCRYFNISSGGGTTNNYYTFNLFNQTSVNVTMNYVDNWTWHGGSGWYGTAVSLATLSYIPFQNAPVSVSTTFNIRATNVTEGMYISHLRVDRGASLPTVNISLYRDGTDTGFGCSLLNGGTYAECRNTTTYFMRGGSRYAWGLRAVNATTVTGINIGYHLERNISRTLNTTINVSAPTVPFTRTPNCVGLDLVYQNNRSVPITVEGSIDSSFLIAGDVAYVEALTGASTPANKVQRMGTIAWSLDSADNTFTHAFSFNVAPYENYTLTSNIAGSGSVSLTYCNEVTR